MTAPSAAGHRRSLVDAFEEVARRHPERTALSDGQRKLSYADLARASSHVAAAIAAHGVGRAGYVGILVDRTVTTPVAILGVLKSGAAYVPLDPTYPAERLSYLVADSAVKLVVGRRSEVVSCGLTGLAVVDPDDLDARTGPTAAISGDDPAYVIYTSGSTGQPKGCVVSHGNVLALLDSTLPLFDLSPADRWAIFHSHSFDFSVWELWGALLTGAAAACVPLEVARSPEDFLAFLDAEQISVLNQVPSAFRGLVRAQHGDLPPPASLRYVIFGGERVDVAAVRDFIARHSQIHPTMVNMYGITEITVHATFKELRATDLHDEQVSPIGRELPHLRIQIRSESGQPLPDGEIGEMWIAGSGVASGYLNRPELTQERFPEVDGERYYRSGDLGRRRPDGELEYLGRNDEQVKLRGFRIELAEIDAVLRSHDDVRDAAVAVVDRASVGQVIAAFVVARPGTQPADLLKSVRRHAAAKLPAHMVPSRYRLVDALPLTASGKLDRNRLSDHKQGSE
ncbi:amino acid adenylation domain-containing protein [Asanoa ferruginea]|uniref:Amino acid adenylation domain-containing protein n=1 Tax=Asanoa ferruginea TaxID=53367 RepID=A0A3D9ZQ49_9ACTN|nr:amino acid adenylation domain-containing protein [Asanoa ferruginea]REF99375.1 amino acid adenylation domain-containing protein [Asanoa ferruginea]GIF45979.1 hypothetical protein Afe04nite_05180 [Asanoa ferruginea]